VETAEEEFPVGQTSLVRDFTDKSLAPFASKLAELNMPVTEESARTMRELMGRYPGLSLDEAAFLASNKITGDEGIIKAALALLSSGEKTDAILARLLALINSPFPSGADSASGEPRPIVADGFQTADSSATGPQLAAGPQSATPTANASPLTDLLSGIMQRAAVAESSPTPESPLPAQSADSGSKTIITQGDSVLQSTNVENAENMREILQNGKTPAEQPVEAVKNPESGARDSGLQIENSSTPAQGASTARPQNAQLASPGAMLTTESQSAQPVNSEFKAQGAALNSQLSALLSEIPEFRGTPASALERFSNMLLRVARDGAVNVGDEKEKLAALLDKLFTRIGKGDKDAGARLKIAREELYARLALVEEAISRAAPPARAEMAQQTQRLMEHVRILNSIDQFAYMQLPVQFGQERKTAELYMFKRRGKGRADPENVNILLALDLENMGHWEALLNIRNKEVSIQMEVQGAPEKEHFSNNTVMLHDMLAEAGFKLINTGITYSEKETTPVTALAAFDKYAGVRAGAIDFMI